jgi:hypothetical protein
MSKRAPGHVKWPKLHNIKNMIREHLTFPDEITYKFKVKLHGTNAAIGVGGGQELVVQSRNRILGPTPKGWSDNHGFAAWVHDNGIFEAADPRERWTIFGEWCGRGINSGVAAAQLPRFFAVFAIRIDDDGDGRYVVDPSVITTMLATVDAPTLECDDVQVIPWHRLTDGCDGRVLHGPGVAVKMGHLNNDLIAEANAVGQNDPLVESWYGVKGPGEGLVIYALRDDGGPGMGRLSYSFKLHADEFATTKQKRANTVNLSRKQEAAELAQRVITPARIRQAWGDVVTDVGAKPHPLAWMGDVMRWLMDDVTAECGAEMSEAKLSWKDIAKPAGRIVREWVQGNVDGA